MKIMMMEPGMVFADELQGKRFIFVGKIEPHPLWSHLALVIWREVKAADSREHANEDHPLGWWAGEWFHDALSSAQEVGPMLPEPEHPLDRAIRRQANVQLAVLGK